MKNDNFFTFNESMKKDGKSLTASMEDYLEMIYRLSLNTNVIRINELSTSLNVHPPSATKMVQKLADLNLINYTKYGFLTLTDDGKSIGELLLKRHHTIETFLKLLGLKEGILNETEKIEHTINENTLQCLSDYVDFLKNNPEILNKFEIYKEKKDK